MVLPSFDLNTSGDRGLTTQGSAPFLFWVAGSHFLPRESQFLPTLIREHSECPHSAWKWSRLAQPGPRMVWTWACPHTQISPGLHLGHLTSQRRPCGSTRRVLSSWGLDTVPVLSLKCGNHRAGHPATRGPSPLTLAPIPSQQPARPSTWTAPSQVGPTLLWQLLPASPHPHFLLWVLVGGGWPGFGVRQCWGPWVLRGLCEPVLTRRWAGKGLSLSPQHHIFTAVGLRPFPERRLTRGPHLVREICQLGAAGVVRAGDISW